MGNTRTAVSAFLAGALVISGCKPVPSPATNVTSLPSLNQSENQTITLAPNQTTNQTQSPSPATALINVRVSPPGSGTVTPSTGNYTYGSNITFTAVPADPYVFTSWTYDYTFYNGGAAGSLGNNQTLNLTIGISENITAIFAASPAVWNSAVLYGGIHPTVAPGQYFIIAQQITGGPWGPDSISVTYNESMVALIDRKYGPNPGDGPPTPGFGTANVWLLFKALQPGYAGISLQQVMGSYKSAPAGWTVTITNGE